MSALVLLAGGCSRSDKGDEGKGGGKRQVLQNKGSDTLVNVAQAWAEAYKKVNPNLAIAVTGGGSGTGISALINGTVDIASSSRSIKDKEIALAKEKGIEPKEITMGYDALAVYVHKDNPLNEVSIAQLAEIYGEGGGIEKWSQLDVKVPGCDSDEIIRVSRQNNSGTYVYFKEAVLGKGKEYELGSRDMHGSKDVVDLVAKTPCAIGYSGLAYATEEVKMPCVSKAEGKCVAPSVDTAIDRSYPIARPLFMYTNGEPKGATKEYLDWILSDAGQCIIQEKGYAPAKSVTCS
ncbi:MAG TPA: phosphate ABC transporter substrate-binding protein [Polyangiaceae bacterium]|nr:phosphate ABC transporter substrate-binding protein [Polyangiaceae bacterium]